jgi:ribosomal 50S subunit-recycling heat shock protein
LVKGKVKLNSTQIKQPAQEIKMGEVELRSPQKKKTKNHRNLNRKSEFIAINKKALLE